MKRDIKYAAAVESEAQTLETIKAASAAHDVQFPTPQPPESAIY